jgi:hypothetical protein
MTVMTSNGVYPMSRSVASVIAGSEDTSFRLTD